jgi:hypothetical protein
MPQNWGKTWIGHLAKEVHRPNANEKTFSHWELVFHRKCANHRKHSIRGNAKMERCPSKMGVILIWLRLETFYKGEALITGTIYEPRSFNLELKQGL